MNDQQLAKEILDLIGGPDNISSATHCVTRLRVSVNDVSKVKKSKIGELADVIGVNQVGNQTQVILGGKVHGVYGEFKEFVKDNSPTEATPEGKKNWGAVFLDTLSGIFNPILPAIIGAGLLKGLIIFLMFYELVSIETDLYQLLNIFSDAAFFFLPILLAYSAANRFKANPYVAGAIAGVLVHPNLIALMGEKESLNFLGLPVISASYASSVLPIIMGVLLMAYVERFLTRIIPKILKTILVPLLTLLIVAPITLIVLGPIGTIVDNAIGEWFIQFYSSYGMIAGALFGAAFPFLVLVGMHIGFSPVMLQSLASYGVDYIMGLNTASNSAQAGATTAVYLKTKNAQFKAVSGAAALNAIIGITEPALFGVTSRLKKPLIAVSIGGGLGGAIAGYFRVEALGLGTGPIAGLPLFLGDTFIYFVISCVVAYVVAFVLAWFIGFDDIPEAAPAVVVDPVEEEPVQVEEVDLDTLVSPLSGEIVALADVNDTVFSTKMMGEGVAIIPRTGKVIAPVDGQVVTVFETGHAVGIQADNGSEILIHVGLDTVELEGAPFTMYVKAGEKVKAGDLLLEFNIPAIKDAGYDIITPIVITNSQEFDSIVVEASGDIQMGQALIKLESKEGVSSNE